MSLPVLLFLLLPLAALVFRNTSSSLLTALSEPSVTEAIQLSLWTTALTTALTILAGTPAAYLLARRKFAGKAAIDTMLDLPIVLPPSVAGIALLVAFGRRGLLGPLLADIHVDIAFTRTAVVLAQLFVASPFYIKAAAAGFGAVDRELEAAAAIDGASAWMTFWKITLPLSMTAAIGGAVMTWARALGEFGATIIFAGNYPGRTQTMPLAIYMGFEIDLSSAIVLALILLGVSFAVLALIKGVLRRELSIN